MNIVSVLGQFCPKGACPLGASFTKIFDMLVSVLALETASTCMFKFFKALTLMCLVLGHLKIINFPFVPNGKFIIFRCSKI